MKKYLPNQQGNLGIVAGILLTLVILGGIGFYFLNSSKPATTLTQVKSIPPPSPTSTSTPISTPAATPYEPFKAPENWLEFSNTAPNTAPNLLKGMILTKYPPSWRLNTHPSEAFNSCGTHLANSLAKYYKDDPGLSEGPPENSAYISFRVKKTNLSPDELVRDFENQFCQGASGDTPTPGQLFNGYKAAFITQGRSFPGHIIFSLSPDTVGVIDIDFYDSKNDPSYSAQTTEEIHNILKSVIFQSE